MSLYPRFELVNSLYAYGSPAEVDNIRTALSNRRCLWAVVTIATIYDYQNEAIGAFARSRGLDNLPLSTIEQIWINDPQGLERFFEDYRLKHPARWARLGKLLNVISFTIFQIAWMFSPTHVYLVSLSHNGYTNADLYGDNEALERLRVRFSPFNASIQ